ncbi:MAG: hypothetical protein HY262_12740 [Chloroflexi bacterium]|nr:hypothetical protein [Chloroflexota bacterium]
MPELAVFLAIAAVLAVAGIRVGMLVAPRLDRMTEPHDEDDGADTD